MMRIVYLIALIAIAILFSNCGKDFGTANSNSNDQNKYLPVSESAQIPEINAQIGIETGEVRIIWTSCDGAIGYELERTNMAGGWEIAYSGTDLSYYVGVVPNNKSISFRVRAVYKTFVSNWSQVMSF